MNGCCELILYERPPKPASTKLHTAQTITTLKNANLLLHTIQETNPRWRVVVVTFGVSCWRTPRAAFARNIPRLSSDLWASFNQTTTDAPSERLDWVSWRKHSRARSLGRRAAQEKTITSWSVWPLHHNDVWEHWLSNCWKKGAQVAFQLWKDQVSHGYYT